MCVYIKSLTSIPFGEPISIFSLKHITGLTKLKNMTIKKYYAG